MILSPYESDHSPTVDNEPHEVWMALNCGEPDGGCSCGLRVLDGTGWIQIGTRLGIHLQAVLT